MLIMADFFHAEVLKLKEHIMSSGYPLGFFNHLVKRFLDNKFSQNRTVCHNQPDYYIFTLQYYSPFSDTFRLRFNRFSKRYNVRARVVFKPFKVGNYFSFKSLVPNLLKSNVVYKYTCLVDPVHSYIGKLSEIWLHESGNTSLHSLQFLSIVMCVAASNMIIFLFYVFATIAMISQ